MAFPPAATSALLGIHFLDGPDERKRVEEIADLIIQLLKQQPRPGQSESDARGAVENACRTMMMAGGSQRIQRTHPKLPIVPKEMEGRLRRIQKSASKLLAELADSPLQLDLLLFGENRVVLPNTGSPIVKDKYKDNPGTPLSAEYQREEWGAKARFIAQLIRFGSVDYMAPHFNADSVKDLSAEVAELLIDNWSDLVLTGTENEPFRELTSLLYEIACPSDKDELHDLKRACNKVIERRRAKRQI